MALHAKEGVKSCPRAGCGRSACPKTGDCVVRQMFITRVPSDPVIGFFSTMFLDSWYFSTNVNGFSTWSHISIFDMVFPVSSVMLDRIDDYRTTLQSHSSPLMDSIEWRPTADHNVDVLNDTADLYRYFDCTGAAEFLYACVQRTVEHDLPQEIDYLRRHDQAMRRVMDSVEMPDSLAENLIMFIRQNKGTRSKKRRENEFKQLTDEEAAALETIVQEAFEGFDEKAGPLALADANDN